MSFGNILYIIAIVIFVFITFGIVKNYYRSKFDDKGRRTDMLDAYEDQDPTKD
ncbi:MAG: hypothetical protein IE885_00930 [Campylobacterales bacterium]|nr:hypothetical protein [Campylobacterales bacterium]